MRTPMLRTDLYKTRGIEKVAEGLVACLDQLIRDRRSPTGLVDAYGRWLLPESQDQTTQDTNGEPDQQS